MQWIGQVAEWDCPMAESGNPDEKSAFISTPKAGVHLAVSSNEYLHLRTLLQKADSEIKVLELLALFEA